MREKNKKSTGKKPMGKKKEKKTNRAGTKVETWRLLLNKKKESMGRRWCTRHQFVLSEPGLTSKQGTLCCQD